MDVVVRGTFAASRTTPGGPLDRNRISAIRASINGVEIAFHKNVGDYILSERASGFQMLFFENRGASLSRQSSFH
jgi:hypothetical protein